LLWDYRTPIEAGANRSTAITRGIALYGDNVYIAWDVDIIAIDARTGKETWRTTVADRTKGFRFTAGPIAAKGKIVAGMANCTRFVEDKCSLVALDATTGKEAWRIAAIVSPGEPGDDTWTGVEGIYRAGGDMWVSGSYDAELNLVYWSTAQAKPWTRFARGTEGDALYSNTTLAINPDTGKVVWYRQTIPGESHDLDEVFEAVLADFGPRKSLFKMGKMGILWEMDRATGRILRATDIGIQNLVIVDPATGAVRYREDKLPKPGVTLDMCPTTTGVKNWPAMSYSPEARAIYVPHFTACAIGTASEVAKKLGASAMGGFGGGKYYLHPSAQGHLGALTAMDLSGTILWQHRHRAPFATAALATGGGLVFAGTYDRYLFAFDAKTGAVVWQLRGPTSIQGFPISYAVHGRQYIAVPSGTGGPMLAPQRIEGLVPGVPRPQPGNSMMVFALPK
jgi:alcohol dehydrogenase (cytochrome c)